MEGLADFLETILGGTDLVFFALSIGSLLWGLLILRPWRSTGAARESATTVCVNMIVKSAFALVAVQCAALFVKTWLIAQTLDRFPFPAFAETVQFQAGFCRTLFALALGMVANTTLRSNPDRAQSWLGTTLAAIPLVLSGAWLVHGAGRFEDKLFLMSFTVLHQLGAALWLGGIAQLLSIWMLKRRNPEENVAWARLLSRFSAIGIASIAILLVTGIPMGWIYIQTLDGLIGTGYGNLLSVKIVLLAMVLCFAAYNFRAARYATTTGDYAGTSRRVPYFIEAETFILVSILFTAAALSSQPPSADIPDLTASFHDIAETFKPRIPRTESPSHHALLAGEAGRTAIIGRTPSSAATEWSDYNHNMSGIFLFFMTIIGMLSYTGRYRWTHYWPLGFVGLSIFLLLRSDAEAWPLGPLGFWESTFGNGEIFQHRIATLVAFALGVFEYQARKTKNQATWLPYVFPILCAFGGLLLLTHSHVGFQGKAEFLIQVGHTTMGLLSIVVACGRWLELRLAGPVGRVAGFVSVSGIFLISLVLMFYREPLH
ncbi:MAG: CopD family protein [Methylococcaceae bacterium]|nr:CopD family protein [Methylococcaceae bacterium]